MREQEPDRDKSSKQMVLAQVRLNKKWREKELRQVKRQAVSYEKCANTFQADDSTIADDIMLQCIGDSPRTFIEGVINYMPVGTPP